MAPVIIFGPTGNIGSVAARTAAEQGAEVILAMRDVNKAIQGLSKANEEAGNFKRVQADLTDPKSVETAVRTSGATRAFAYLAFGAPDHMKGTFEAMKAGGIVFVVFLSSFTIAERKLEDIPQAEMIAYAHAQGELSLHAVFGADNFVAVRPGGFATNILRWKDGIVEGHVQLFGGHSEQDGITAGDMGTVSGTILVSGPKKGQKHVYLYGPQMLSQQKQIEMIGEIVGKEIKITPLNAEEAAKVFEAHGMPPPFVKYLVHATEESKSKSRESRFVCYDEGVQNVELYTGRKPTGFEEWVRENKNLFSGGSS